MTEKDAIEAARVLKTWCAEKFETNGPCRCQWDGKNMYGKWECKLFGDLPMSWHISEEAQHGESCRH